MLLFWGLNDFCGVLIGLRIWILNFLNFDDLNYISKLFLENLFNMVVWLLVW